MQATPLYYRLAMSLLKPLYQLKLASKTTLPNEKQQRFGQVFPEIHTRQPMIWCHAVSLGETNTAEPILRDLLAQGYALWVTNTTHTGYNRVEQLFAPEIAAGKVYHSFVPVDSKAVIDKFLAHVQPVAALFIETELWGTTLAELNNRQIATILVNGRLSEKSFKGYQKAAKLSQSMMENLSLIIAQDSDSAKRFRQLGATSDKIRIASSLKWSSKTNPLMLSRAEKLRESWHLSDRAVILAASTHEGEELAILDSFLTVKAQYANRHPLLIIVPRHPERFDDVAKLIDSKNLPVIRRSQDGEPAKNESVYLADSMGELGVWYALSDIAIVGGSLVNIGGHNPIEAAIVGKPIIMGQYTQSCQLIVDQLKQAGALVQVNGSDELTQQLAHWLANPKAAQTAGHVGQILAEKYQDATKQQLAMIMQCIADNKEQLIKSEIQKIDHEPVASDGRKFIDDL